jgi:hypothetical protein
MHPAGRPGTLLIDEEKSQALFSGLGYSPPASGAQKKDKRWLKVIIATTPYI